jgi:hypothetical protein
LTMTFLGAHIPYRSNFRLDPATPPWSHRAGDVLSCAMVCKSWLVSTDPKRRTLHTRYAFGNKGQFSKAPVTLG